MHNIWNVRVRMDKGNMNPIRVKLDGVMQLDLRIEWATILMSFLADPCAVSVSIASRFGQWYDATWNVGSLGTSAVVSSRWSYAALSPQSATIVAAKLKRAIDEVTLNDSRFADPLTKVKLRMDDNLRGVFG